MQERTPTPSAARPTFAATAARVEEQLRCLPGYQLGGRLEALAGPVARVAGIAPFLAIGDRIALEAPGRPPVLAEIAAFQRGSASAMPLGSSDGLGPATVVTVRAPPRPAALAVADGWLGRVVDPLGRPLDGAGDLPQGRARGTRASGPAAMQRGRLGAPLDFGIRALNAFAPGRQGQRLGLFAGSGVGKSTLLGMLARHVACDVTVVAMVGERGREVRPFVRDTLGEDAMRRSVVVVATSDAPPMLRREALYAATTIAEHFRDRGRSVLLLVDSLTRFCQALREVGLALGELPGSRGWPPSVFAELPCLLERAGPGLEGAGPQDGGCITALYTVLVDGDDPDEPISDAARGLLDGHVWLDRRIAERGRFPAIDVGRSLSRTALDCGTPADRALASRARALLARAGEAAELLRLGVYVRGGDAETDHALDAGARLEAWLAQPPGEVAPLATVFAELAGVVA